LFQPLTDLFGVAEFLLDVGPEALLDLLGVNAVEDDRERLVVHHGLHLVAVGILRRSITRSSVMTSSLAVSRTYQCRLKWLRLRRNASYRR